jgi:hypothetical protein
MAKREVRNPPVLMLQGTEHFPKYSGDRQSYGVEATLLVKTTHERDYSNDAWASEAQWKSVYPAAPRHDVNGPLYDLKCAVSTDIETGFWYREFFFETLYQPGLPELEKRVKALRPVVARYRTLKEQEGSASTPGDYFVLVARALGVQQFVRFRQENDRDYGGGEYLWLSPAEAKFWVNRQIAAWINARRLQGEEPNVDRPSGVHLLALAG